MRPDLVLLVVAAVALGACAPESVLESRRDPMAPAELQAEADLAARDAALDALGAIATPADTASSSMVARQAGFLENPLALATTDCAFDFIADAFRCAPAFVGTVRVRRHYRVFIGGQPVNAILGTVDSVQRWRDGSAADSSEQSGVRRIVLRTARDSGVLRVERNPSDRRAMFATRDDHAGSGTATIASVLSGGTRLVAVSSRLTIRDVVRRAPESLYPFPESGAITIDVTATARWVASTSDTSSGTPMAARAVLSFTGSPSALLEIGARRCAVDLRRRLVSSCW